MAVNPRALVQELKLDQDALKLQTPCAIAIVGPSMVGKTSFIIDLIKNRHLMFTSDFHRIIYCVPASMIHRPNPAFAKIRNFFPSAELYSGLPSVSKLNLDLNITLASLIIIDDQMTNFLNSAEMCDLITLRINHLNLTCCFVLHNYFCDGKYAKSILRNVQIRGFFLID